jgi:hypothetical protein
LQEKKHWQEVLDKKPFELPFNFNFFFMPGIYAIINKSTNKTYIGEASNLADRLSGHVIALTKKKHDCKKLQEDWDSLGQNFFDFLILDWGLIYIDRTKRLQKEREYIQKYKKNTYNKISFVEIVEVNNVNQQYNSIKVIVDGQLFPSISAAARAHGISISTARNNLDSSTILNWEYANSKRQVSNVAKPVVVDNKFYSSVAIAAAKNGISVKTLRKKIKTLDNWHYYDELSSEEKTKVTNVDKNSSFAHGRKVQVRDVIYSSIRQAATAHGIADKTVRKRINSKNSQFADWKWFSEESEITKIKNDIITTD